MKISFLKGPCRSALALSCAGFVSVLGVSHAEAQARAVEQTPALIIANEPLPPALKEQLYRNPFRAPAIDPAQISGPAYYQDTHTPVGRKIQTVRKELFGLQGAISDLSQSLNRIEKSGQDQAASYYASIATINTQLQVGTTPGNPRLVQRLGTAQESLGKLESNVSSLSELGTNVSAVASRASFLQEEIRATYSLEGAVEEDHVQLAQLEDAVANTVVVVDRLLNNINDDISRTSAYLGTERANLRVLATAVRAGDLMGKSLSNHPFGGAQKVDLAAMTMPAPAAGQPAPLMTGPAASAPAGYAATPASASPAMSPVTGARPLVKIRFDRPDIDYEQPVYMAVNEALARYPSARFQLVAVHPNQGNVAKQAIESARARRNAERVLRSLTEMGLDMGQIDLSYAPSPQAVTSEVHLYVR